MTHPSRSLRHQALLLLLGFVAPLVVLLTSLSWWQASVTLRDRVVETLGFQADLARQDVEGHLDHLQQDLSTLSRNPVIANGIADGATNARIFLGPLLMAQDFSLSTVRGMLVTTFEGRCIWPAEAVVPVELKPDLVKAVAEGKPRAGLQGDEIRLIYPILYGPTGTYEGAILLRVGAPELLPELADHSATSVRFETDHRLIIGHMPTGPVLEARRSVRLMNLELQVVATQSETEAMAPRNRLLQQHLLVGLAALFSAGVGAWLVARRLTARLVQLSTVAVAVTTHHNAQIAVPDLGDDEIGRLADALRTMLTDLDAAQRSLEDQITLRTSQLKDALVLGRMGNWTFEVEDNRFTFNDEFYALFNTTAAAQGGYRLTAEQYAERFLPAEIRPLVRISHQEMLASTDPGRIWEVDHPFIRADGSTGILSVRLRLERDATGRPQRMVGVNQDISARKQLEMDLAQARDAADLANRAKSSFLATMSHEIRTPLNGVIGMANLLDGMALTAEQREMVTTITTSGRHLLTVINDILDFSKIEAGRFDLEAIPFSLRGVVAEVVSLLGPAAETKKLNLTVVVDPTVPEHLLGDPGRLRQILTNLVGNALKFTDRGGVMVQVLPTRLEEGHVDLTLRIEDSGVGIPSDRLADLFQPFVQTDASITRRFGGTGLGLVISRRLAELMGGTITVVSTLGQGTTFTVQIRVALAPTGGRAIPVPESGLSISRPSRILLVEDNRVNQRVATLLLQRLGHTVLIANDGREALDILAREPVQMVLMDCQMPVMDGFTATRALRDPATPVLNHRVPVIALTANAMQGDREECLAAGMDDFLTKPLETSALTAALARWLPA